MTISNFDDLRFWFFSNQNSKQKSDPGNEENAPHWSLYSMDYGKSDTRVAYNNRISDMEDSFKLLVQSVRAMNNPDGTKFRVQTHAVGRPTHPNAQAYIQVFEGKSGPATQQGLPAMIGAHPDGYVSRTELQEKIEEARKQWELERKVEDLEAQINGPSDDPTEKFIAGFERIMQTPVGQMLAMKLLGTTQLPAMPTMQTMNGTPGASTPGSAADELNDTFEDDIEATANALGISDTELAAKMRRLVEQNPTIAQQLLHSV